MNTVPKFWTAVVAIAAMIGVIFVLVTPAPDELPSTGPHSLDKMFTLIAVYFASQSFELLSGLPLQYFLSIVFTRGNLLSLTCVRLC